jgi:hypothetical protein
MSGQVVASLEGMRVVVDDGWCELQEYNFVMDCWVPEADGRWSAERRTGGWTGGTPSTGSPR